MTPPHPSALPRPPLLPHLLPSLLLPLLLLLLLLLSLSPLPALSADPPKSRPVPISIDFGSEFIKVSSVRPGAGSYHIVVDEQSKRKVPAVISFEGGERHFGNGATQLTMRKPKETYWYAHRLLGKAMDAPEVAAFREQGYPYELMEVEGRGSVGCRHLNFSGQTQLLTAEELVAMSLEHVIKISEADAETFVSGATITVPSYFTQVERQAMLDAADLAGLNVYALLNENTAAAIQYGIDRTYTNETQPHTILLYNMGSTSTKVSIVTFSARQVKDGRKNKTEGGLEVLSLGYDPRLGGQYFESILTDRIAAEVNQQLKTKGKAGDVREHPRALAKIRSAADKAKNVLSANQDTHIHLPSLLHDTDFKLHVTREQFYEWSRDLLDRVALPITAALADANLTAADLAAVAIVGGGVRIPAVQSAIKAATGVSQLTQSLNGDEAMAMGAEFKSIELSKQFKTRGFTVEDITPYGVSVRIENIPLEGEVVEEGDERWSKQASLFRRYNKLSKKKTVTFSHDHDFSAALFYDEASIPHLPSNIKGPLLHYNVTGLTVAKDSPKYGHLLAEQKPRVSVVFLLDQSGLVSLISADATLEETKEVPVTRRVKKEKNVTDEAAAADADAEPTDTDADAAAAAGEDAETPADSDSTANETAAANSTTADVDEWEEVTEYKQKKVTHKIPLTLTSQAAFGATSSMSFVDKKEAKVRLAAFRAGDELKRSIAIARNNLESFIYNVRALLNDGGWDEVSVESQREELFTALSEAEEWLYEQKDDAAEPFVDKLAQLQALADPIKLRHTELVDLPKAISASQNIFNFSRTQQSDYPTSRPWVKAEELDRLRNLTEAGDTWLQGKMAEQSGLAKHEVPIITSTIIYRELMGIADLSAALMKVRKPPEPVKPKAAKAPKGGKKNATAKAAAADGEVPEAGAGAGGDGVGVEEGGASGEANRGESETANGGVETEVNEGSVGGEESTGEAGSSSPNYDEL